MDIEERRKGGHQGRQNTEKRRIRKEERKGAKREGGERERRTRAHARGRGRQREI